jgi:hypothetical protein
MVSAEVTTVPRRNIPKPRMGGRPVVNYVHPYFGTRISRGSRTDSKLGSKITLDRLEQLLRESRERLAS